MEENTELMPEPQSSLPTHITVTRPPAQENGGPARPDAKQLRVEHVGRLLESAYVAASTLKLTRDEEKKLSADFPDELVELRPYDGIVYLSHMTLRERLWEVFGRGQVAEICRERMMRQDTNEVAIDLVLLVRGIFVAEAIGTAKFNPANQNVSFADTVESAWSDALRKCCKHFGVGTQMWRPAYIRDWLAKYAVRGQRGGWARKEASAFAPAPAEPLRFDKRKPQKKEPAPEPDLPAAGEKPASVELDSDDIPF